MAFYERFVTRSRDHFYTLDDLIKNYRVTAEDTFNFGYDVIDEMAKEMPDSLAMLWLGADDSERRFTFWTSSACRTNRPTCSRTAASKRATKSCSS